MILVCDDFSVIFKDSFLAGNDFFVFIIFCSHSAIFTICNVPGSDKTVSKNKRKKDTKNVKSGKYGSSDSIYRLESGLVVYAISYSQNC